MATITFEDFFPTTDDTYPAIPHNHTYDSITFKSNVVFSGSVTQSGSALGFSYSPATFVVATLSSGYKADYIATGTNDQVPINAAITAAAITGGKVFIHAGTYKIQAPIVPLSNVCIQGEGTATVLAGNGTNFSIMQNLASLNSPTTDIEICDLKIDGTGVTNTSSYSPAYKGIYLQYSKRLKLHGLYVYGTLATGIGVDFLVDTIIDRCVVDTCGTSFAVGGTVGSNGIGIGTAKYAVESWVVSNCVAVNTGNVGFMCEAQNGITNSEYMTFANCLSYNNGTGFLDSGVSRVSFNNCWAWANTTRSGFLVNTGDIAIPNGVFMPNNVYLTNCYAFDQTNSSGFVIVDDQIAHHVTLGYNIHLQGCVATGNSVAGFVVQDVSKVSMIDCKASTNGTHGVLAYSDNVQIPFKDLKIIGGAYYNNSTGASGANDGIRIGSSGPGIMSHALIQGASCYDDNVHTVTDGTITTGTAILTSATAGFNASMVGNTITVNGAGSAGGNLVTTILSWQSLTQVTVAANASTTVSGATTTWGTANQRYGIGIAGTTNNNNIRILHNDLYGNKTAQFNTGAISTLEVRGNAGYNPIGQASISVTASPFTYTAGNSPEDVFINGGTVSSIVKGSTTLASASPSVVHLEPNQAVVVTYSSAPTMAADKY